MQCPHTCTLTAGRAANGLPLIQCRLVHIMHLQSSHQQHCLTTQCPAACSLTGGSGTNFGRRGRTPSPQRPPRRRPSRRLLSPAAPNSRRGLWLPSRRHVQQLIACVLSSPSFAWLYGGYICQMCSLHPAAIGGHGRHHVDMGSTDWLCMYQAGLQLTVVCADAVSAAVGRLPSRRLHSSMAAISCKGSRLPSSRLVQQPICFCAHCAGLQSYAGPYVLSCA